MQDNGEEKQTMPVALSTLLETSEEQVILKNLNKTLCLELLSLIVAVNKAGITPQTVNATCNAAAQIHKLLRLNFDIGRSV
jgi:hypothetical protein